MSKELTGLFLGAGASFEAGLPIVWELTSEIRGWLTPEKFRELNAGWRRQGSGYTDAVVEDFISILIRPDVHYESILGYLEVQYRRQHEARDEYHSIYSWLVELVYILLCERQLKNKEYFRQRLSYFEGFRVLAEKHSPLWVFSLNHDVVVEAIAAHYSIPIHFGLGDEYMSLPRRSPDGQVIGSLRAQIIKRDILDNRSMNFPNPGVDGIYLLKIHGALDVFTFNDGEDVLKILPVSDDFEGVIESLRIVNDEVFFPDSSAPDGRARIMNEIAYADDEGVMQFLRRSLLAGAFKFSDTKHQVLPKSLLKHFRSNINFLSTLVCVGYGFGDSHINSIIREWLEFSADREVEIVSPNAAVPAFLSHVAPQVALVKSTTTEYFDSVAGIERSNREHLERKLSSIMRGRGRTQVGADLSEFQKQEAERVSLRAAELVSDVLSSGSAGELQSHNFDFGLPDDQELVLERMLSFFEDKINGSSA